MIVTAPKRILPFSSGSRVFLNGRKILNPEYPPKAWKLSSRLSKKALEDRAFLLLPESLDQTLYILKYEIHACGIIFYDEPVGHMFPFGPVWLNLNDGKSSWGIGMAKDLLRNRSYNGVFGHLCQDGCKFSSGTSQNKPQGVEGVIIKKAWVPTLASALEAFVIKNEAWHNGKGVYA